MRETFKKLDLNRLETPCYVVDAALLERNLQLLAHVQKESGAKVLLALKSFAMWHYAPLISRYLSGVCASGLHEALLGREYFQGEVHTYSAAFPAQDIAEVLKISDHVIFNSFNQWKRFQPEIQAAKALRPELHFGLRINPQNPEGDFPLYDPSVAGSRLGIIRAEFQPEALQGISGLHFHNLCEQDIEPLKRTLAVIERNFADVLPQMKWINFGGGHHITRQDYQVEELIELIKRFRERWQVEVILEPGEAIALGTGVYVSEVLDVIRNEMDILVLDGSCTAHLPDVLEMPYRPEIMNSGKTGDFAHNYRLGGLSCLAGDIFGDYSFPEAVKVGQKLMFMDMSHYTMVKTTTFNGVRLPSIIAWDSRDDSLEVVRRFDYQDFKNRLS